MDMSFTFHLSMLTNHLVGENLAATSDNALIDSFS